MINKNPARVAGFFYAKSLHSMKIKKQAQVHTLFPTPLHQNLFLLPWFAFALPGVCPHAPEPGK